MVLGGAQRVTENGENNDDKTSFSGDGVSEWRDIPAELLLRILSAVDDRTVVVASGVCRGWREAVSWGLTRLSLSWCKKNMNSLVISLAPKFPQLQILILRQDTPRLEDYAIEKIARHCLNLQELDLSKSFKLTDRSLYALSHGCPNLVKLNISGCSALSDTALSYLVSFCRKLKNLNLCGCVRAATDKALTAIGYNCRKLQYLNLGWCDLVGDDGVKSLAYGCPDLRSLDLCGCVLITDESVIALANNCLHLRSLGLYYCQNITDRAMYSLAQSPARTKNRGAWAQVEVEEGLTNLNISQCTALTPPAVQAVCDSFPSLHTCPGRHSLIISGCLNLTSVHCACAVHRGPARVSYWAH
ncbi:F-box protein SKP2A [Striga hermonthica]|uniref:F-box protein SKP2A n=1 Tax=Striga hermonthica TaxID=68872 RepID=A0A9N7R5C7_STRHE|nr:F-box protein SKP2A [Striga hermonthica]